MDSPNEKERALMISWICHRYGIKIIDGALRFAASEAHSYTLTDLINLLNSSNKMRIQSGRIGPVDEEDIRVTLGKVKTINIKYLFL